MAEVTLAHVSKSYFGGKGREIVAVSDLNLEVAHREFVVLVGPSGCGKSTTLRMIAGLEETSQGDISIAGRRVNDLPPKDRDIAMVFQNYALFPHMTAYDNISFGLRLRRYPKNEIRRRVVDAANVLGIQELLGRKPNALSGGERQRVAVGRAIVLQPKVFLFDEPLSNLDAKMRAQMRAEITRLHHRLQATIIYVTHDQTEAMTMGDRIVVMDGGKVQQNEAPLTVYNEPDNLFVAGFIGDPPMNFISGTLKFERDTPVFRESDGGTLKVQLPANSRVDVRAFAGKSVVLGIRPEHIELARFSPVSGGTTFPAIIDVVEPTGAESNLYLQTGAHTLICRSERPLDHADAGRREQFTFDTEKARLFDSATAKRIA